MSQKIQDASRKIYGICHKVFLISGLIAFIAFVVTLVSMAIYWVRFGTLLVPFYDISPILSFGMAFICVFWLADVIFYAVKRKISA